MKNMHSYLAIGMALLASPVFAEDRALLVGVGEYANLDQSNWLFGPKNDVEAIGKLLVGSLGYKQSQIGVLLNENATKQAIIAAFETWLIAGTEPGDKVYFYFSGHGTRIEDENGDEEDNLDEVLAPYDIEVSSAGYSNTFSDDELHNLLAQLEGRFVSVIVDACNSGTITRGAAPDHSSANVRLLPPIQSAPIAATRQLVFESIVAQVEESQAEEQILPLVSFTAASPFQFAFEDDRMPKDERQGVFTHAYISALSENHADTNQSGDVSYSELLAYLRQESSTYCAQKEGCIILSPTMDTPDLVLEYAVKPRFTTTRPEVPVSQIDFNPAFTAFTAKPAEGPITPVSRPSYSAEENLDYVSDYLEEYYEKPPSDYVAVQEILGVNPDPAISLFLNPSNSYQAGDALKLRLTSPTGGDLILYDLDDQGNLTQLFPNDFGRKATRVSANIPFNFPDDDYGFDLEVSKPGGTLLAIVVSDRAIISDFAPSSYGLTQELDARQTIAKLVSSLSGYVAEKTNDYGTSRQLNWSYGMIEYSVK